MIWLSKLKVFQTLLVKYPYSLSCGLLFPSSARPGREGKCAKNRTPQNHLAYTGVYTGAYTGPQGRAVFTFRDASVRHSHSGLCVTFSVTQMSRSFGKLASFLVFMYSYPEWDLKCVLFLVVICFSSGHHFISQRYSVKFNWKFYWPIPFKGTIEVKVEVFVLPYLSSVLGSRKQPAL